MSKKNAQTSPIDPNRVKTRDHLLVKLLTGATKGGIQKDIRKEANRRACREDKMNPKTEKKNSPRGAQQENLAVLTELKYLKGQLAAKEKVIQTLVEAAKTHATAMLQESTKAHRAQAALQIVGLPDLSNPDFDKKVDELAAEIKTCTEFLTVRARGSV